MTCDPNKLFVINAIKYLDIVNHCNDTINSCGYTHQNGNNNITIGDERLTDKLCQEFANNLSGSFKHEDEEEENLTNAVAILLEEMGFLATDTEEDLEYLRTTVELLEIDLAKLKDRLNSRQ